MGIWERPKPEFLDALAAEFGFDPPREPRRGHRRGDQGAARRRGPGCSSRWAATSSRPCSDTEVTEDAMRSADLTVHVSTKLNRSHVVTGREALILPALGRSESDRTGGREQRVTVEDSMSAVHASRGPLKPASPHLRSEVDIVCSLALATLGDDHVRAVGGLARRLRPRSGAASPTWCRAARRTTRRSTSRAGSCCRTRRATRGPSTTAAGQGDVHGQPDRRARRARGPAAAADAALPRPVQHHDLRARRPLPRRQGRPPGGVRAPRRHRAPRVRRRRPRRPGQRVAGRLGADRAGLPDRRLRPAARVRRGVLPRDQPAGPARLQGRGQQHPDLEVGVVRAGAEAGRSPGRPRRATKPGTTVDRSRRQTSGTRATPSATPTS